MTVTVAQFIEHLKTLPQDAVVQCLAEKSAGYSTWVQWENVTLEDVDTVGDKYVEIGRKN